MTKHSPMLPDETWGEYEARHIWVGEYSSAQRQGHIATLEESLRFH